MQNINTERQNVLENINIGAMIENFNPSSMQGSILKKNLSEAFNAGNIQKISSIIDVIVECSNLRNIDNASYVMCENLTEKLNESIKTKLIYCVETLEPLRENVIHESLKNTIESLIVMEDADIINKIRSGALSPFKSIQSVHFVIESCQIVSDVVSVSESHKAYHPVTYHEISENKTAFIRLHNQVFGINESNLFSTNSPSLKFGFLSTVVENLTFDYAKEAFEIEHATLGKFSVSESKITRQAIGSEDILEHASGLELRNDVSIIVEALGDKRETRAQVDENRKFVDAITAVFENFGSISIADNTVIVESLNIAEKFAFVVNENAVHVITLKSNRMPNIIETFKDIRDGLNVLEKKSGYDAKHFFTNQLSLVTESDAATTEKINGLKLVIEGLEEKETQINGLISEAKKAEIPSPEKILKLNEALQLNAGHLFEQRTNLSQLLVV